MKELLCKITEIALAKEHISGRELQILLSDKLTRSSFNPHWSTDE